MNLNKRIDAFIILGQFLKQFQSESKKTELKHINDEFYESFSALIKQVHVYNPWFTEEFVRISVSNLAEMLFEKNISKWMTRYPDLSLEKSQIKNIGVVLAGNIPMVGFHDMFCVLLSGNKFTGKLSSKDDKLLVELSKILIEIQPEFKNKIVFQEATLTNIDAIIATGSNNSSRYFEYYFSKYPHIIRKNRNSIAILNGKESKSDLEKLSDDVFLYFGMGCRNVAKIMIPKNYNIEPLYQAFEKWNSIIDHHKYANNFHYNRTLLLMNKNKHYDNGFLLLKEDKNLASPLSVLHYEEYSEINELDQLLEKQKDEIQCIVSSVKINQETIPIGKTQTPELWDYADNIDTLDFLLHL